MDGQEQPLNSTVPSPRGTSKNTKFLSVLIILFLATTGGAYFWQHQKVTTLTTQVGNLNKQTASLTSQITSLKSQIASSQKVAQKNLAITVNHTSRFTLFNGPTKDYVAVDVTIKNSSTTAKNIDTTAFQLKDVQNNVYKSYKDVLNGDSDNAVIEQTLPQGDTLLSDQSLTASDSVKGSLVYYVPNTLSSFILNLDGATYQITIK